MTDKEKMYRRQLGGAEAALRRERQKVEQLEELIRDMLAVIEVHEGIWRDEGEFTAYENFERRMAELGIGVEE